MGYFDTIDNKMDKIQESGEIERYAGNAFWFNIGAFGVFVHALVFTLVFWTQFGSLNELLAGGGGSPQGVSGTIGLIIVLVMCFLAAISIFLSVVGLIFNMKAHKAAAVIREKNELNSMSMSFNLLWIIMNAICITMNLVFLTLFIAPNL